MMTPDKWLTLQSNMRSSTFKLLLDYCNEYSVHAWEVRDNLKSGVDMDLVADLIADIQTDMIKIVNEYKRLVRKNLSDEKQLEKMEGDIQITLGPLFPSSPGENSAMMKDMLNSIGKEKVHTQATFAQYSAIFSNFIEPRIYNAFMEILRRREETEPGRFSEMTAIATVYLPQNEERELPRETTAEWRHLKDDANLQDFEPLLKCCYNYSRDAEGVIDSLFPGQGHTLGERGLRNYPLIADVDREMMQILDEYKRLARKICLTSRWGRLIETCE